MLTIGRMNYDPDGGFNWLKHNPYPGRGIVVGIDAARKFLFLIYFLMGRSEASRRRKLEQGEEGRRISVSPLDAEPGGDQNLLAYDAMLERPSEADGDYAYVISNGQQTEAVYRNLRDPLSFARTLESWEYEPDKPHYTPRITALARLDKKSEKVAFQMSIISRASRGMETMRNTLSLSALPAGIGYCVTTYLGVGDELPSFQGLPFQVRSSALVGS